MSSLNTLKQMYKRCEEWDDVVGDLLGFTYQKSPAFRDHVNAYNESKHSYGDNIAQGLTFYVVENGLCLD